MVVSLTTLFKYYFNDYYHHFVPYSLIIILFKFARNIQYVHMTVGKLKGCSSNVILEYFLVLKSLKLNISKKGGTHRHTDKHDNAIAY